MWKTPYIEYTSTKKMGKTVLYEKLFDMLNTDHANKLWKQALGEIQVLVSPLTYNTVLSAVRLEKLDQGLAVLSCTNAYWQQQLESKYYNLLKNVLEKHSGQTLSLIFDVRTIAVDGEVDSLPLFSAKKNDTVEIEVAGLPDAVIRKARLLPDYTFENFAVGNTNQLAFAAAEAVAQTPGKAYNPLFIWGGVGVGKTHLMQGIAHELLRKNPSLKVISCPGEDFTNEIIEAIKTKSTHSFKEKYRSMDLLLLDDVQFLAGKDTAQEEFFHTFNAILMAGGQVVLTSDRPPSEIAKLEDRLRSRFDAGLIVDISKPSFELRTAIVLIKAQQSGINLTGESAQVISEKYESAREMEGFLKQLRLKQMQLNREVDLEMVKSVLGMVGNETRLRAGVRPNEILKITCEEFGVKLSDVKGTRRQARIVLPRQVAMYLMISELGLTYEGVGELFGKDHTTVLHSVEKIREGLGKSPELRENISRIKLSLR